MEVGNDVRLELLSALQNTTQIFTNSISKINNGCEKFNLVSGLDEMALPAEMGLYFDFDVTEDGIPYGCPGFEIFDSVHFNMSKLKYIMDH